jgi:hypothetical protein
MVRMKEIKINLMLAKMALLSLSMSTLCMAGRVQADVLDSAKVSLSCNSYTITVAGHGLGQPNAAVQYHWIVAEGSLGVGITGMGVTDMLSVSPRVDQTFMASATKPDPIPPFDSQLISSGTATLTTGAMTWNTVAVTITGTFECPSLNKCPLTQNYWRDHGPWPVTRLVLGNSFPDTTLSYSNQEARAILRTPAGTDESIELAHQLIAAKLNLFNGASRIVHTGFGSPSGDEIMFLFTNDADQLLGSGQLPQHVDPASSLGQQMSADAAILESYNTGAFTTEPCSIASDGKGISQASISHPSLEPY